MRVHVCVCMWHVAVRLIHSVPKTAGEWEVKKGEGREGKGGCVGSL